MWLLQLESGAHESSLFPQEFLQENKTSLKNSKKGQGVGLHALLKHTTQGNNPAASDGGYSEKEEDMTYLPTLWIWAEKHSYMKYLDSIVELDPLGLTNKPLVKY